MLKITRVPVSLGVCLASLSLASGAIVTVPYLMADSRPPAKTKSAQCRALFATVVNSQNMGKGFYQRKAGNIRGLTIADPKLRSLQSRFSQTFDRLDNAQQSGDRPANQRLSQQANQLVNELNQSCFR
jgi:hypothetical protein